MKIIRLILPLTIISAICAAVLAFVNSITAEAIKNIATLKANKAAMAVLPSGTKSVETKEDPADAEIKIFIGYCDDAKKTISGYAVPGLSKNGYGGDIRLMVGLTKDHTIVTYQVLAANETPGLGSKLNEETFVKQFTAKPGSSLKVKKDGGEIDAITGATITSRAVCGAIADACLRVDRLEGKTTAVTEEAPAMEGRIILDMTKIETAKRVLPKSTATVSEIKTEGKFPAYAGKDPSGEITGYAVVGSGKGRGPEGEIIVHYLYGFTPDGQLSRKARPLPVNHLDITAVDMINAQTTAINAAMEDAKKRIISLIK